MLHVYSNELIANLRGVFSIVYQAELLGLHFLAKILIFLYLDTLRFNLLLPSDLVQALSEEYHIHKDYLVEVLVDFNGDPVKI